MTDTAPPASIWRRLFEPRNLASMAPATRFVVYAGLLLWSFVVLFPLYWVVVTSFKLPIHVNDGPVYLPFVDFAPSVHAWRYIFVDVANDTFRPYLNSVIIASLSTLISMAVGAMAAYALARIRYRVKLGLVAGFVAALVGTILATAAGVMWQLSAARGLAAHFLFAAGLGRRFRRSVGNNDILFWILSNRILPPVVVVLPVYIMFQRLGLLDTHLAMILTYAVINLPIVVWLMRDFFAGIPLDLEESAEIDGASKFEILWTIVLPLARAGLVATSLLVFILSWNEYLIALFLSTADAQTMPILVTAQNTTRGPQWWYMSVLIVIMIVPVILLAFLLQKHIARGLLVGAVKG